MARSCTLICPTNEFDLEEVLAKRAKNADSRETKAAGTLVVRLGDVSLKFTVKQRKRPGDTFSHLILGFGTHFRDVRTKAKNNKKFVLQAIMNAKALIGVVANPHFNEKTDEVVLGLAQALDALIFTGDALLHGNGQVVLDKKGKFAVEL